MRCAAGTAERKGECAGVGFAVGNTLFHRLDRQRVGQRTHTARRASTPRARSFTRYRTDAVYHARVNSVAAGNEQQRVAIRRAFSHCTGTYDACGACVVVHHHRMAPRFGELLPDQPRSQINCTAWRSRHDDGQLLSWQVCRGLSLCNDRHKRRGER